MKVCLWLGPIGLQNTVFRFKFIISNFSTFAYDQLFCLIANNLLALVEILGSVFNNGCFCSFDTGMRTSGIRKERKR